MPENDAKVKDLLRPHPYAASPAWRRRKLAILKRDGWRCRVCGATYHWHVLDIHNRTRTSLLYALDNDLITLCRKCHRAFHDNVEVAR